jgi:hypothetical protein
VEILTDLGGVSIHRDAVNGRLADREVADLRSPASIACGRGVHLRHVTSVSQIV